MRLVMLAPTEVQLGVNDGPHLRRRLPAGDAGNVVAHVRPRSAEGITRRETWTEKNRSRVRVLGAIHTGSRVYIYTQIFWSGPD